MSDSHGQKPAMYGVSAFDDKASFNALMPESRFNLRFESLFKLLAHHHTLTPNIDSECPMRYDPIIADN
jgi:hypothetical protein